MPSKEELLIPRYKVMANYPKQLYKIGDIILGEVAYLVGWGDFLRMQDYPAIFKKLEWWEDRNECDMPRYIRFGDFDKRHSIYKITEFNPKGYEFAFPCCAIGEIKNITDYHIETFYGSFPSTELEYEQYLLEKENK